ncbi:peptidoglycan-binding domain-containing protein [Murinocardiopsis flavida]|nr:peptidoglycan-binding protein [Murinocardiopsis flavida]
MRKTATAIAAGAVVFTAGLAGAPMALADGPDTSPQVRAEIEALPWPSYSQGDTSPDIASAKYLLKAEGYYKGDVETDPESFDAELVQAVAAFDKANDLPADSSLDSETWNTLRGAVFGEYGPGTSGAVVCGIQYLLIHDYGKKLDLDCQYGPATTKAVKEVQGQFDIDADGITGPITYRALVAGGA